MAGGCRGGGAGTEIAPVGMPVLAMLPGPSGKLPVRHVRNDTIGDVVGRADDV